MHYSGSVFGGWGVWSYLGGWCLMQQTEKNTGLIVGWGGKLALRLTYLYVAYLAI